MQSFAVKPSKPVDAASTTYDSEAQALLPQPAMTTHLPYGKPKTITAGLRAFTQRAWSGVQLLNRRFPWSLSAAAFLLSTLILGLVIYGYTHSTRGRSADEVIRVALIADAHLIGPQYVCCSESNDVDNESILKTVERLTETQRQVDAIRPKPSAAVFLGDVIHNGYFSHDLQWYINNRNAYTIGKEIFRRFTLPVYYLWGNHDYAVTCGNATQSAPKALSHELFWHFLYARPYTTFKLERYRFILLNSQLGPTWDPLSPQCNTRLASLGQEQLEWLQTQLSAGDPSILFLHYPLPATMRAEVQPAQGGVHPDLVSTLLAHKDKILALFSGHYHRGLDWGDAYPFPHITLPAVRYDSDNFFLLELPKAGPPSMTIRDWRKNKGGARCSDTWRYDDGRPRPAPAGPETGSCGNPRMGEEQKIELPPVLHTEDIPGPSGQQFNPEGSCLDVFLPQFLHVCLQEGATADCCSILGDHFRPSSAAYASSCMCAPRFFAHVKMLMTAAGRNATELLWACYHDHGKLIQYAGRPGGTCLREDGALPS